LRSWPLGERDRLLCLFTLKAGKLGAVAPGARKVKSRLAAGVELFTCASFLLHMGKSMATVTQLEIDNSFRNIRENISDYACAAYFGELVERLVEEGEQNEPLFYLLHDAWRTLDSRAVDREILARYFELHLLSLLGYRPHFDSCIHCGEKETELAWYNSAGGVLCRRCGAGEGGTVLPLSAGARALAQCLLGFPAVGRIKATAEQKRELKRLVHFFIQYWTEAGSLKTLTFLEKVDGGGL